MASVQFNDAVLLPLMEKHNVDRTEAVKRLELLYRSGILNSGHPEDPATQMRIDSFLEMDSEMAAKAVAYHDIMQQCMANGKLVMAYDRLNKSNFGKDMADANAGTPPKDFEAQMDAFAKFVEETIISRM